MQDFKTRKNSRSHGATTSERLFPKLQMTPLRWWVDKRSASTLRLLDRGPGIPPEQIESMFQPFHRLDTSRSPATGGAGLGLAIVRELAHANGWTATLEARPGGGLAAWLNLPAV